METEPLAEERSSSGRRTLALSLLLGFAFAVGGLVVTAAMSGPDGTETEDRGGLGPVSGPVAEPLPEVQLEGFGEEAAPVRLTALRGTPLVVNFWATWCAPCVAEMPDFQQVAQEAGDEVRFLGVNYRDPDREAARAFVTELGITYALAVDAGGEFLAQVGGVGMPTTLFVDAGGLITYRHTGALDAEQLRGLLDDHLGIDV
ncbi:MAG TPA: TlpA disulfide reductase family protein [Egibacteraceae bacterium]|nr:TlpA disulfide reductase family protein [Egibacteraceae bacterium]